MRALSGTGPCSAVAVGDFIYVLMHGKRVYRYDRHLDTYLALAELPLSNWFTFDVTTFGCYIYAHGGASEGIWSKAFFQVIYHLSLTKDSCDPLVAVPFHISHPTTLVAVPLYLPPFALETHHLSSQYDVRTDEWTKMPEMRQQRRRVAAALVTVVTPITPPIQSSSSSSSSSSS